MRRGTSILRMPPTSASARLPYPGSSRRLPKIIVGFSTAVATDFRYAGMFYHADSGLYLTHYRVYDPVTARWLSRDPLGEGEGVNLSAYVGNNPINLTDPLGLSDDCANSWTCREYWSVTWDQFKKIAGWEWEKAWTTVENEWKTWNNFPNKSRWFRYKFPKTQLCVDWYNENVEPYFEAAYDVIRDILRA